MIQRLTTGGTLRRPTQEIPGSPVADFRAALLITAPRFNKKQQMQWTRRGAHMLLQIRTRTLDGTLRDLFDGWSPQSAANDDRPSDQADAA